MSTRQFEKYIGIPFVDHGRTMDGLDCWGLVRIVMKNECDIDLPSYGEISATELITVTRTISQESNREPWHKVAKPQAFDVVLMRGSPLHVGIMVNDRQFLHVEETTASVLVPLSNTSVARRILGFRRHIKLLSAAA